MLTPIKRMNNKKHFKIISKNELIKIIDTGTPGIYGFLNPFSALYAPTEKITYCIDSYYLSKFLGVEQASFDNSSMAPIIFDRLKIKNLKALFIGGSVEEEKSFKNKVFEKYNLKVLTVNGYEDIKVYQNLLKETQPNIIILGMGTPLQEHMSIKLQKNHCNSIILTCGGFISQGSLKLNYFPKIVTLFHLHFLYRFYKESHVRKRLLINYPIFLYKFINGKIKFEKK